MADAMRRAWLFINSAAPVSGVQLGPGVTETRSRFANIGLSATFAHSSITLSRVGTTTMPDAGVGEA